MEQSVAQRLTFVDFEPAPNNIYQDVVDGLSLKQKAIPPKYFYDERGSRLFDEICETQEYYPTRTEMKILSDNLAEICHYLGSDAVLIEPGSGSSQKVRLLLDQLEPHTYMPLDISSDYLLEVSKHLVDEFPGLQVAAACVDFTQRLDLPHIPDNRRRVVFFPGSSIGNFEPRSAEQFLRNMACIAEKDGGLLIGVDLKKDNDVLHAAYNDKQGVTAQFNLNVLYRINSELGANFKLNQFQHHAFYNDDDGRIEVHLRSRCEQRVKISGQEFSFSPGETIHTENSYKYTVDEFSELAARAGYRLRKAWTDDQRHFAVMYFDVDSQV